jgi:O-antigen ligase
MFKDLFRNFDGWAWYAFAFGLALTTSTALTSIMASISLIWFATHFREWRSAIAERSGQPVFKAMLVFLAILMLGVLVSFAHGYSPWEILGKHTKFMVFFILIGLLRTTERRRGAFLGFGFGMVLSMLLSLIAAGFRVTIFHAVPGGELSPFLNHTEHNVFLSLAVFGLSTLLVYCRPPRPLAWLGWLIAALSFIDIIFLVQGRTGQIMFVLLALSFLATMLRTAAQKLAAVAIFCAAVGIAALSGHSALNHGLGAAKQDLTEYKTGQTDTSVGFRMQFAKSIIHLIKDRHPLIGNGTGGFREAYADYYKTHPELEPPFPNPHDDYLFYWAENGLIGVAALVGIYLSMFYFAWRERRLHGMWMAALALSWCVPGTANSVMLDHVSGYTFVVLLAALVAGPLPFSAARAASAAR